MADIPSGTLTVLAVGIRDVAVITQVVRLTPFYSLYS